MAAKSYDIEGDWAEYPGIIRTDAVCADGHVWSVRWSEAA